MGLFSAIAIRAMGERSPSRGRRQVGLYEVHCDTFGDADIKVQMGDMDGSGQAPGIQVEFMHEFMDRPAAIAMDAEEAELTARALLMAAAELKPHERLKTKSWKWKATFHDQ